MQWHTMIDLETLDSTPYSAILQIGACVFNPYGDMIGDEKFNVYLNEVQGSISMDTLAWWLGQEKAAVRDLAQGVGCKFSAKNLRDALAGLNDFIIRNGAANGIWSHGATFDIPILRTAAGRVKMEMCWKYWNEFDTRTVYLIGGKPSLVREGVHHNALDDAVHQAKCVQEVMRRVGQSKAN